MHLAAMQGIPTIGLHGPSNPLRWGPAGERVCALHHKGVTEFPDMEFRRTDDERSFTCHIEVFEVLEAFDRLLHL
jgi:ADP-heptose:LPS heptosyltransferase